MKTVLALVDDSAYSSSVCALLISLSRQTSIQVTLLHVLERNAVSVPQDLSGAIGLGARSTLLDELSRQDENTARNELANARSLLSRTVQKLHDHDVMNVTPLLQHGTLLDALQDNVTSADIIILGKRGTYSEAKQTSLGRHFEEVLQQNNKPVLIASREVKPINNILIAYDGSQNADNIVAYVKQADIFKDALYTILMVGEDNAAHRAQTERVAEALRLCGRNATAKLVNGKASDAITDYLMAKDFELLIMGAFGHSTLRRWIVGSTTREIIAKAPIPVLVIR
ncbi:universal stress protein [Bartonella sp. LJL80]